MFDRIPVSVKALVVAALAAALSALADFLSDGGDIRKAWPTILAAVVVAVSAYLKSSPLAKNIDISPALAAPAGVAPQGVLAAVGPARSSSGPIAWLKAIGSLVKALLPFLGRDGDRVRSLAEPVLRGIEGVDVDVSREGLVGEIRDTVAQLGASWLSDAGIDVEELRRMNVHDFRMWLATARIGLAVSRSLGFEKVPALDIIRSIATGLYSVGIKQR